jgi:hypothetical protein
VFESITLAYLITGHTHENIDGTFGQLTVKLSAREFSDDKEVVAILQDLLRDLGIDRASQAAAKAYKLDEAADWQAWWGELSQSLTLSALTGPEAPHWFRICRLRDLGSAAGETEVPVTAPHGMPPKAESDDVVMVVKDRMSDDKVTQVVRLVPAAGCDRLTLVQPQGQHSRRPGGADVKVKVAKVARELRAKDELTEDAAAYLVGWAEGTRPKQARPKDYHFLQERRWASPVAKAAAKVLARMPRERQPARPVRVRVRGLGGADLDVHPDEDEVDPGPLIEGGPD